MRESQKNKSRKKAAHEHGLGYAADGDYVSAGARMGAVFAHGHVDVIERLAHDQFQFLVHFGVEPVSTGQILGPLKITDRDSACIGQNIRDYEDPFTGENLVS